MTADEIGERAYTAYVEAQAASGQTASIADARAAAEEAMRGAIAMGTISVDDLVQEGLRLSSQRVHERVTERGKRLITRKAQGQGCFADLLDGVVVPLGEGHVGVFGDLAAFTLTMADQPRFANLVAIQEDYAGWRKEVYEPAMKVLVQRGCTIRAAVAQGWLQ